MSQHEPTETQQPQATQPAPRQDSVDTSPMAHIVKGGIPLLVLALAIGGGIYWWKTADHTTGQEQTAQPHGPMPVTVYNVATQDIPLTPRFLGQTESSQQVEIRARVAGYLTKRSFEEGQEVTEGQVLYQIDARPFEAQLAEAKARLASAQATADRAGQQLKRYQGLQNRGSATEGELEEWEKEQRVAQAQVALAEAEIDSAQLQLDYATIRSPIDGVIGQALKHVGSYVDSGTSGLVANVYKVDPIYVRYSVTEREMLRWQKQLADGSVTAPDASQMKLQITLADGSVYPHEGTINYVDIQVDEATGTSVIRATVPNPDGILKPGQFIHAAPQGIERVDAIAVPQGAVRMSPAGASVLVIGKESKVENRPVQLGEWTEDQQWLIESGLQPGDQVITNRLMMLQPGMPVALDNGHGHGAQTAEADTKPADNQSAATPSTELASKQQA